MIIGMLVQSLYNLVDGIWVAGLGANALAAIGLFFPVFFIIMGIGVGIGVGGSSAISRSLGANDKHGADSAATHALIIGLTLAILISGIAFPFLRQIFNLIGAKERVSDMVTAYSRVLVGGAVVMVFSNIASGILRGEGDTKRAMYAMITGSILNIILDPIFIYTFRMGVVGAAWATLTSIAISSSLLSYWLFIRNNTYVKVHFRGFTFSKSIAGQIIRVGIPASFSQMSMAISVFILNILIVHVGGSNAIAVYTSAWRFLMLGVVPIMGIGVGVTAVTAAAFGARDVKKVKTAWLFGVKVGFITELVILSMILIFAPWLAKAFTYSKGAVHLAGELTITLRILADFLPFVPLGLLTASMFNGIGMGERALIIMIIRALGLRILFAWLFGVVFGYGFNGISWGIVVGNITASSLALVWGYVTIRHLARDMKSMKTKEDQQFQSTLS